jgi:flagellar protein FlbD
MDKQVMYLNPDHIISVEETPDTVITLFNGNRYLVTDTAASIISKVVAFRARIVRRAGSALPKKYLGRARTNQFKRSNESNHEGFSVSPAENARTPFHSRDY